jgi:hypothetical protein
LQADLDRLTRQHGDGPVQEALAMVETREPADQWDAAGHKQAVESGIERTIAARRLAESSASGSSRIRNVLGLRRVYALHRNNRQ